MYFFQKYNIENCSIFFFSLLFLFCCRWENPSTTKKRAEKKLIFSQIVNFILKIMIYLFINTFFVSLF